MTGAPNRLSKIVADLRVLRPLERAVPGLLWCFAVAAIVALAAAMVIVSPAHIAASAWLSTAAMAAHSPSDYGRSQKRIWKAYGWAVLMSSTVATAADLGLLSTDLARELAVVLIMLTVARMHAPVVCLPFAVGTGDQVAPTAWVVFAGATALYLVALGCLASWSRRTPRADPA